MSEGRAEDVEGQPPPGPVPVGGPAAPDSDAAGGSEGNAAREAGVSDSQGPAGSAPPPAGGPHGAAPPEPAPEDELAVAQRERAEYLALAQRAQADFENYRRRAAKETANAGRRAKGGLIGQLLPVVDNLERALLSAGEQEDHLAGGVKLVHSELISVLARNGVQQFDPAGERFDPSVHEALSARAADGVDPGLVVDVVEKGYSLDGTVLRPARVVVSG